MINPNSRRSTLANAGCFLEDLEPKGRSESATTTNTKRSETMPSSQNNSVIIVTGDANQLLSANVDSDGRQERANSATSIASTLSLTGDFCKICHCGGEPNTPLITPCFCSGSLKHVHQECLQKWIKSSDIKRCELCKYPFAMQSKVKPFCQWEKLDMSSIERRKLLCSVTFHIVAITCVVWSLYILIDRTADEIKMGDLKWPFWTKLVVVAIGFTGGLVFMYIQCKVYVHLCRKWKAYNRIIVVQEAPEGLHKPSQSTNKVTKDEESVHSDLRRPSLALIQSPLPPQTTSGPPTSNKSNAETQTALRGVSIVPTGEIKIFRELDKDGSCSTSPTGLLGAAAPAYFFADCECEGKSYSVASQSPSFSVPSSRSGTLKSGKGGRKSGKKRRSSEAAISSTAQESPCTSKGDLPGSPIDNDATRHVPVGDVDDVVADRRSDAVLPPIKSSEKNKN